MTARVRFRDATATLRTATRIRARDGSGNLRIIQKIRMRDTGGILQTVWQYLSATLSPTTLSTTAATSTITTASCTVTAAGGTAPFTYYWDADDPINYGAIFAVSYATATTTFRRTGCVSGDTYSGNFKCVVTDALGATATSNLVSVTIIRT